MDTISSIVMPFVRAFWGFVSMCLMCSGLGGLLAGIAMWWDGWFHPVGLAIWSAGCLFLIWTAEPVRKRYLKWVRVQGDGEP